MDRLFRSRRECLQTKLDSIGLDSLDERTQACVVFLKGCFEMPEVCEPIPGEMVAYGLSLENSDFGNGALSIRAYLLRI